LNLLQAHWRLDYYTADLPWYAVQKAQQGAFTTLLGLCLHRGTLERKDGSGTWTATALGDSCMFQVRDSELKCSFPLQSPEQFTYSPVLISSIAPFATVAEYETTKRGEWRIGDCFYLATDALA